MAGIPGQLVGAEPAHAGGLGQRRQAGGEAEAVGQPAEIVAPLGETAAAVGLPQLKLPQQRSRAQQHAIAFHPGAIDGLKPPLPHRLAQAGEQLRPVLLDPGIEGRTGVGEVQLGVALHQRQGRFEGAHRRLPGVGHWPQPGQIQMGMAQHVEAAGGPVVGLGPQPGAQCRRAGGIQGVQVRQLGRQGLASRAIQAGFRQGQLLGGEHSCGVGRIAGLLLQLAGDQGAVVVQRGAQPQLQLQGLAPPPGLRQGPAAGGVEQIPLVHQHPIHPQLHRIGPPTQHQAGQAIAPLLVTPGGRTHQLQLQLPPAAAPRPDHQAAGMPIGASAGAPGVVECQTTAAIGLRQPPQGPQIQPGLRLKRFNPGANAALRGLRHG